MGRDDGEDDIAARDELGDGAGVGERARALLRRRASAFGGPQHFVARGLECGADRGTHLAGVE